MIDFFAGSGRPLDAVCSRTSMADGVGHYVNIADRRN